MRALLLKAGATVLTLVAAIAAAVQVSSNIKSPTAPLHPTVLGKPPVTSIAGGRLKLSPAVRASNVETVTSTYAS